MENGSGLLLQPPDQPDGVALGFHQIVLQALSVPVGRDPVKGAHGFCSFRRRDSRCSEGRPPIRAL